MEIKDLAGFSAPFTKIIECLSNGISAIAAPWLYKRMERAKLAMSEETFNHQALLSLKEEIINTFHDEVHTARDERELNNIIQIYGQAMLELKDAKQLPSKSVSPEWSAHFYDKSKGCSDENIQVLWSKILAGEIQNPGKYFKRTLTVLNEMELHEAQWFVELCQFTLSDSFVPTFVFSNNKFFKFNKFQSLVDCGLLNSDDGIIEFLQTETISTKSYDIKISATDKPLKMSTISLTDSGIELCELVKTQTDENFLKELKTQFLETKGVSVEICPK